VNDFTRRRTWSGEGSGDQRGDVGIGEEGGVYASHFQISFQL
jgi:hypothetical protein